jgi:hypothetical protein
MSDIIDEVFTSIHLIVDKKISDLKLDKTIQAVIVSHTNTQNNLYRISYQGVDYDAYGPLDRSFDINSLVLVLVPENNFSNKKIIISLADKQSETLSI